MPQKLQDSPYDPGDCQRCCKPSDVVLKIGQQVVNGEDKYLADRRLCLACCEIEKSELWEAGVGT
ncbi:hypothetical protein ELG74_36450 (plasmid) [Rhizobium leguminosarum]|nr:hypothetical protein ELG74_36450 [Rhizobium leguminosarum]